MFWYNIACVCVFCLHIGPALSHDQGVSRALASTSARVELIVNYIYATASEGSKVLALKLRTSLARRGGNVTALVHTGVRTLEGH